MNNYSVLMSVYAKERSTYLEKSIQSIIEQTYRTNDFVIVCDGPLSDELYQVLNDFKTKYPELFQFIQLKKNMGLGNALNAGMKYCKNEIIARMDSDDISLPNRCEMQVKKMEEGYDIVSGTVREFTDENGETGVERRLPENPDEIVNFARRRCPFNHPCVMYRKSKVLEAGGYQDFYLFEDYYLWARMLIKKAKGYNISTVVLNMRAGQEMYSRRGGMKYLKSMLKFRTFLYKHKISKLSDYIFSVCGQSIICMVPCSVRKIFYKRFLRN